MSIVWCQAGLPDTLIDHKLHKLYWDRPLQQVNSSELEFQTSWWHSSWMRFLFRQAGLFYRLDQAISQQWIVEKTHCWDIAWSEQEPCLLERGRIDQWWYDHWSESPILRN